MDGWMEQLSDYCFVFIFSSL